MARPRRFERPTPAFGGQYSIQLSYGRLVCLQFTSFGGLISGQDRQQCCARYNGHFSTSVWPKTMSEESFIKTPKQLIWAVVLAFIVPIIVIVLLVSFVTSAKKPGAGSDAFTPEAVAERIAPVAKFELDPAASTTPVAPVAPVAAPSAMPAVTAVTSSAAVPAATVAAVDAGKALYEKACMACHVAAVAGAPKFGDKTAWAPRIKLGVDALTASVIKGKGAMPPRGAAGGASDADIKAAVQYMVNAAK